MGVTFWCPENYNIWQPPGTGSDADVNYSILEGKKTFVLTQLYTEGSFIFLIMLCRLCALKAHLNVSPLLNAEYGALWFCHLVCVIIYL